MFLQRFLRSAAFLLALVSLTLTLLAQQNSNEMIWLVDNSPYLYCSQDAPLGDDQLPNFSPDERQSLLDPLYNDNEEASPASGIFTLRSYSLSPPFSLDGSFPALRALLAADAPAAPQVNIVLNVQNAEASRKDKAKGFGSISTLAEPTAVNNNGAEVLYTGNVHAEVSDDSGKTFKPIKVETVCGYQESPIGDLDSIYDPTTGYTFWSELCGPLPLRSHGTVAIVTQKTITGGINCVCRLFSGEHIVPDYPHLGLSGKYLFLSSVNFMRNTKPGEESPWIGTTVRRFAIADLLAPCVKGRKVTFEEFAFVPADPKQVSRVFVPVEDEVDAMHWGMLVSDDKEKASRFRVFRWPNADDGKAVKSYDVDIKPSLFDSVDCTGGKNYHNWMENELAVSINGFRLRGALIQKKDDPGDRDAPLNNHLFFFWNVAPDDQPGHTQAHIHGVEVNDATQKAVNDLAIYDDKQCTGYPAVAANPTSGPIAISLAKGGKKGGDADDPAVQGYVGLLDPPTLQFSPFVLTAEGDYGPPLSSADPRRIRYGDYFSVHHMTGKQTGQFSATNYAFKGGDAPTDVNARYIVFEMKAGAQSSQPADASSPDTSGDH